MEKGTVVEFPVKGSPRLAVVEGLEGKASLKVSDTFGNSLTVALRDLEFRSNDYKLSDKGPVSPAGLAAWRDRSVAARSQVDLATVWELYAGSSENLGLESLAECLWDSLTGERAYALFSALRDDRLFFKEKGGRYEPRPQAQVEELRKQQAALANKEKIQAEMVARLQARFSDGEAPLGSEELRRLEALKKFALWGDEAPDKNSGLELLKLLERPQTEAGAFQLLTDAGLWHRHENLDVHRAGLTASFEPELEAEAASMGQGVAPTSSTDLTALASVTIDDDTTTEVDDALAVENLADGRTRFWIHIADPGRWIVPGSPLDQEARRRGTTVYLPTGRFTMFPPSLAERRFSLNPDVATPALSFGCVLAGDGALLEYTVIPSTIRVARRLSYHQAEDLRSSGDRLITSLAEGALLREAWRRAQGAVMINLPETEVKVDLTRNKVEIGIYSAEAARDWVAEFMILAGEAAARFAAEKKVPMLYRVQKAGDPIDVDHLPQGPVQEFAKIVSMTRSGLAVEPGPHAGLGLAFYVQATSPIRRYGDLAVHRQLKAAAAGEPPPYTADELATLAAELDPLNGQASKMERNADRYWVTEYLARQKGKTWEVLFLGWFREDDKLAQVLIAELGYRAVMKLPRTKALGETFTVKVAAADPRKELLTLVEA
jgi:exoribonuclease-2